MAENAVYGIEMRANRATGIFTHKERIYIYVTRGGRMPLIRGQRNS